MAKHDEGLGRRIPRADSESPGDIPAPLDMWLAGEEKYKDLPPEEQWAARCYQSTGDPAVQKLFGSERSVRFRPGDRFSGRPRGWLIDRLVLSPQFVRFELVAGEPGPSLLCDLDGEEIDVFRECGGVPLGRGVDFRRKPVATVGSTDVSDSALVGATLYSGGPWLVSTRGDGRLTYIPVPTNEMGVESDYCRIHEAWAWVEEMTALWATSGAVHNFAIASEFIDDDMQIDVEEMLSYIAQAARGGGGLVTFNGRQVYDSGAAR